VGPSQSIVGTEQGRAIDDRDLVVRINHQWPVPPARVPDVGARMDILYHCCNGDFPVARLFVPGFERTRFVCVEEGPDRVALEARCVAEGIPAMDVTALYLEWLQRLHSYPNTGFVAITHLLDQPIAQLYVAGFSFNRDPYYEGYPASGNRRDRWSEQTYPRRIWWHDADRQLDVFREMAARDSRIVVDQRLADIIAASPGTPRSPQ
jgi:hypothetical protein